MNDVWYLALAYGVIWLGLFAYLFRLTERAKKLRRDVDALKEFFHAEPGEATRDTAEAGEPVLVTARPGTAAAPSE